MRRRKLARGSVIALAVLLNSSACAADDDSASTGAIHPGDVTTIAEAWSLALRVAIRRSGSRNALQAAIERETVETTRRFGTVRCNEPPDGEHDPLALLATRRIDDAIASLKNRLAVTYRSQCIGGRLAVTFDVKANDNPR
jgi:hypothetical protein